MTTKCFFLMTLLANSVAFVLAPSVQATISLDRTRIVFPGNVQSVTLDMFNKDLAIPYQAQAWLEDEQGEKLHNKSAFVVLPPEQSIEPKGQVQLKIQAMPAVNQLPKDRETLFYLNLLGVPPESDKENVVQIKLQTRIKMFYRPEVIAVKPQAMSFQEGLTLTKNGTSYIVNNSTPYFITLAAANTKKGGTVLQGFTPVVISPKSSASLDVSISALGEKPVLAYVNDYGHQIALTFHCTGTTCKVDESKSGE